MEIRIDDLTGRPLFCSEQAWDHEIAAWAGEKYEQLHLDGSFRLSFKKEHIENLIDLARRIKAIGVKPLRFEAFDTRKIDEYAAQAKASWGTAPAYKEYEEKAKGRTREEELKIHQGMIDIFAEFGQIRDVNPASDEAQAMAKKLQDYITEHMYTCTKEILKGLGKMYAGGGDFTTNIDKIGGEGTAVFASKAIEIYCR